MPRPPASLHPQPLPVLSGAQLPAMTFIPDEDSEAGRGIVTARIAGPLRGPARAGPGCLALFLVLKDMSAVGAPGSQGGGSFQSGPGRGTVRSSAICFLQEGRKRAQPRRADGGLRRGNEQ